MEVRQLKTELPRIIAVGPNMIEQIVPIIQDLETSVPVTIVHDNITWGIAGKKIHELLEDATFEPHNIEVTGPFLAEAERVAHVAEETGSKFIIGVGGGSVIDTAKYGGIISKIPFISVPTAASHDGIASMRASLIVEGKKKSFEARPPIAVIADLTVISKAPFRFLAAGSGDTIANKTAVLDWELAHRVKGERIGEYPKVLSEMTAEMIIRDANLIARGDIVAAKIVTKALITSSMAMCIAGSSRPASGSEHLFSHALDMILDKPALHGEQCGIGTIIMMYLHGGNWEQIRDTLKTIGAPVTAKEADIPEEAIIEALLMAHTIRPERYTILGSNGLTYSAAVNAAETTGVIS